MWNDSEGRAAHSEALDGEGGDLLVKRIATIKVFLALALVVRGAGMQQGMNAMQIIQVSAPITAEQAGKSGTVAASSVMRVVCQAT